MDFVAHKLFETESWETANKYLDLGWVLCSCYTTCYDTVGILSKHQTVHYCLAWTDAFNPPKYPEKKEYRLVSALNDSE